MADVHSREQRSHNMSRIRAKDTNPEMVLRKYLHAMGYRYRLHSVDLPGSPDLTFPGRKKVIFVNGCFWHMHECRFGMVVPKTNAEFWRLKREATAVRDAKKTLELQSLGWQVLVIWECQLRVPITAFEEAINFLER